MQKLSGLCSHWVPVLPQRLGLELVLTLPISQRLGADNVVRCGGLSGGAWEGGMVASSISSESKAGSDAQLADVLAAGKQGTGKPVMGWLVRTGALGRVTLLLPIRGSTWD